jgi:hypothetical protein
MTNKKEERDTVCNTTPTMMKRNTGTRLHISQG